MDETIKVFLFFLLTLTTAHAQSNECGDGLDEKTKEFILEDGKETREFLKAEIDRYLKRLEDSFNQKLLASHSQILSELERLNEKVDANQNKLTQGFVVSNVINGINVSYNAKFVLILQWLIPLITLIPFFVTIILVEGLVDKLVLNMSELLNQNLKKVESKILSEVASQSENTQTNHDEVLRSFSNLSDTINQTAKSATLAVSSMMENQSEIIITAVKTTPKIRTRVIVEEVHMNSGTIEFDGGANSDVLRKIWMLQHDETNYISDGRFVMDENQLGQNAHLTIWSTSGSHHLYNGSQGNWRTERRTNGNLILVTLTMRSSPSADDHPKFKLRFNLTRSKSSFTSYSSEVVRADGGVTTLSYPKQNAQNYPPLSLFHWVIAPSNGRPFALILKHLDIPEAPGNCRGSLEVWLLKENPTDTKYELQPSSAVRECGQRGNISELIGRATVAIVRFHSDASEKTGRGFRVEVAISGAAE